MIAIDLLPGKIGLFPFLKKKKVLIPLYHGTSCFQYRQVGWRRVKRSCVDSCSFFCLFFFFFFFYHTNFAGQPRRHSILTNVAKKGGVQPKNDRRAGTHFFEPGGYKIEPLLTKIS